MKTLLPYLSPLLLLILFTGCKDNPVDVQEDTTLTAELTLSSDHVHTLSEITYTVTITNSNGEAVTDMETVEVQRKGHGDEEWSSTELTQSGSQYTADYTFNSSGEYDLRVTGVRQEGQQMEVLYEMEDHFEVGRAHEEVGDYRIEYENFPGHMHEGETGTIKFWVYEKEENDSGNRPPVSGLSAHIHCNNPDGTDEHHSAVAEEETGIYVTDHTFTSSGEAHMGFHFDAPDNTKIEADFHIQVSGGH